MKRKILVLLSFILLFFCELRSQSEKDLIIDRIEFVYGLKPYIADSVWHDFDDKVFDVPLVYYTETDCYVANPTSKFLSIFDTNLIFETPTLKIYRSNLLDSIPFHMSVGIILGDSVSDYNYRSPFMNCSSVEVTQKMIPGVSSMEEWATMVIHEYFHGFQFKHQSFLDYFEKKIAFTSQNKLKQIYRSDAGFRQDVDKENGVLLLALASVDSFETRMLIHSFFDLRDQRRSKFMSSLDFDIASVEAMYETLEGSARYIEYSLYRKFATAKPEEQLMEYDPNFHSYAHFRDFKLQNSQWLYETDKTTYFYATGFNIARLLDKLGIDYKSKLFKTGEMTLEQILRTACCDSKTA